MLPEEIVHPVPAVTESVVVTTAPACAGGGAPLAAGLGVVPATAMTKGVADPMPAALTCSHKWIHRDDLRQHKMGSRASLIVCGNRDTVAGQRVRVSTL